METISFACPQCKNLMAVGVNLMGRSVRCPHCKAVISAPTSANTGNPVPPPPPPQQQYQAPQPPAYSPPPYVPPPVQYVPPPQPQPQVWAPPPTPQPQQQAWSPPPQPQQQAWAPPPVVAEPPVVEVIEDPFPNLVSPEVPLESPESIFGEVVDEDLFGTKMPTPEMPVVPPQTPVYQQPAQQQPQPNPWVQQTVIPPPVQTPLPPVPQQQPQPNPWTQQPPVQQQPQYQQPQYQQPQPPPPGYATQQPNPWAQQPVQQPQPVYATQQPQYQQPQPPPMQLTEADVLEEIEEEPKPVPRPKPTPKKAGTTSTGGGGGGKGLVIILGVWAVLATAAAVYGLFLKSSEPPHPFNALPDVLGEYEKSDRKKISSHKGWPPVNDPIPENLRVKVGTKLVINQLEIEPLRIERRQGSAMYVSGSKDPIRTTFSGLALKLHLKNVSSDVVFVPTDPALDRSERTNQSIPPYAGVQSGKFRVFGAFPWTPGKDSPFLEGGEQDREPLNPGDERETMVLLQMSSGDFSTLQGSTAATWRLHLRTGLTQYDGKDVSVTSVVGVVFDPSKEITVVKK